ncbi:TetR/AcrR family transcriptional regulator [Nocardia sp. 2]|uniref:TetR/AcrR family transcriptional regulator n=1 Tax=Nocardia acididurans TaxID=2802282 RepID=A0ABS1M8J2_9NOCA|nr:TetR/AcrR family transcriptional regulator [Nocardia acididurans]MBL1076972.1 TetR/AcrR family transcriptional regulator [Nocardia acididurans]
MADPVARDRMVAGAADMIRRRGLNATSVRELAKHASAPLGSTYHYFPGGKQQLAAEAVTFTGDHIARLLTEYLRPGPIEGLRSFLALWRKVVESSDFRAGCPVLAVSVEDLPDGESAPHQAAATAFAQWTALLAASLREHGAGEAAAESTATLIVAAAEGAIAMSRAERSTTPMDRVAAQLESLVRAVTTPAQGG